MFDSLKYLKSWITWNKYTLFINADRLSKNKSLTIDCL